MSSNGLIGTLNIKVNDGETDTTLASLRNCTLTHSLQMLPRLDPNVYGWKSFVPGNTDWSASGEHVEIIIGGSTASYLATLQSLAFNKTVVTIEFTHDNAQYYSATAFIDTWQIGGADGDLLTGSFTIKGVTPLVHLDLDLVTPVIYMGLQGSDLSTLGGAGIYQQSIDLDNLQLLRATADEIRYLTCIHKQRKLVYQKTNVSDNTLYILDLSTGEESVFAVISSYSGTAGLRTLIDSTNDLVMVQVDKTALQRSEMRFYDYDGVLQRTWTPVPDSGSGVNVELAGLNPALDEAYFDISAFWHYQAFTYSSGLYKRRIHRFTGASLGPLSVFNASQNEFYTRDGDGFVSRIPNGEDQADVETKVQGLNPTFLNQIYYATYDQLIYAANDNSNQTTRFDRNGLNDANLLGADLESSDVSCTSVCMYEPNLRE